MLYWNDILEDIKGKWLVRRASQFAAKKHKNHKRKYTLEPYWNHLHEVAMGVKECRCSYEAIAAAYLHDTVEDTDTTFEELEKEFGPRVTDLVRQVTDYHVQVLVKRGDNWYWPWPTANTIVNRDKRKEMDHGYLATSDYEGATIKLADIYSNEKDIHKHDQDFYKKWWKEKNALLYQLRHGNMRLYNMVVLQHRERNPWPTS